MTAAELAIDADLAAGRHHEVVAEIERAPRPSTRCASACTRSGCSRCIAAGARPRRSRPTGEARAHAGRARSASSRAPSCGACTRRSCARTPRWTSSRRQPSCRASSTRAGVAADGRPRGRAARGCARAGSAPRRARAGWSTLVGAYGMGKTRLAAALAGDAHRAGATVLYAAGTGPPEAALAALARAREARRPTLLVVDDAERAPGRGRSAGRGWRPSSSGKPVLALATGQAAALGGRASRNRSRSRPLDATAVRRDRAALRARTARVPLGELWPASRGRPRPRPRGGERVGAQAATRRVDAPSHRARRPAAASCARAEAELAGSVVALQVARERLDAARRRRAGGVPVQGPRVLRRRRRRRTSSAGSGSSRSSWPVRSAPRCSASSGPSGSGKSSVVKAGLLARLTAGVLPGSDRLAAGRHQAGRAPDARAAVPWRVARPCWPSTSSRSSSPPAGTRASARRSSTRWWTGPRPATAWWSSPCEPISTGAARRIPELSRLLGANQVLVGR